MDFDKSVYKERCKNLIELIKREGHSSGAVLLFSNFEDHTAKYKQESSFSYFTGLKEPASVLLLNLNGDSTLFFPETSGERCKWLPCIDEKSNPKEFGLTSIEPLGKKVKGYELDPFFSAEEVCNLIDKLQKIISDGGKIFVVNPKHTGPFFQQKVYFNNLAEYVPKLLENTVNILPLVASLRCLKSKEEIEFLYKAIEATIMAQAAAAEAIEPGKSEADVNAAIDYVFTASKCTPAFPSIVGAGKNSTVLHYSSNDKEIKKGDLVVVDIGASYKGYSADITRTYPASGKFTDRQREVYNLVLETQQYIASIAKPGMWLKNADKPEQSLHHLAVKFLESKNYAEYFVHGLGHFLGMDTHDVGDYSKPIEVGNVFTIEPGIYIPKESIGVRIEDDYWVVEDGVVCLSEDLPKYPDEIEEIVQATQ